MNTKIKFALRAHNAFHIAEGNLATAEDILEFATESLSAAEREEFESIAAEQDLAFNTKELVKLEKLGK